MKFRMIMGVLIASLAAAGCETNTPTQNKVIGATAGAVLGGVLGKQVGGGTRSAVVGAALGGAFGYLAGSRVKVTEQADGSVKLDIPGSVLFATDSATISPDFQATLDQIAQTLNEHPDAQVRVVGYTDSTGSSAYNETLSRHRAESVTNYLASRQVVPSRMSAVGMGESSPVADNGTAAGRAQNRRVEIIVVPASGAGSAGAE